MLGAVRYWKTRVFRRYYRNCTHEQLIELLFKKHGRKLAKRPIFVETGMGVTTGTIASLGRKYKAKVMSCDILEDKIEGLKERLGDRLDHVKFIVGDSVVSLGKIAEKYDRIDFLYLDSAPSAMHTFEEFRTVEGNLKPGSFLLIDNACLPEARYRLSGCRKGKVIVPYLLASPFWEVTAHPRAGGSMVSAVCHKDPGHSDAKYERLKLYSDWKTHFDKNL